VAPEQARGKQVDRRVDIWAFGCVLFEMLTGRRAFDGDDVPETIGAIIHKEPSWSFVPAGTPPIVLDLLHRCLEKDPKQRLRDIGDARLEIDRAVRAPIGVPATASRRVLRDRGARSRDGSSRRCSDCLPRRSALRTSGNDRPMLRRQFDSRSRLRKGPRS